MVVLVKIREKFTTKMESNGISLYPLLLISPSFLSFPLNHRKVFANLIISEPGRS